MASPGLPPRRTGPASTTGTHSMRSSKKNRHNASQTRAKGKSIGRRNLSPRESYVLPEQGDDDGTSEVFYDCDWNGKLIASRVVQDDDDDMDDLSEAMARGQAKREQARQAKEQAYY